jgi:hypothetical protein
MPASGYYSECIITTVALLMFNIGVEFGQIAFVVLVLLIARSFKVLEVHWPHWVEFVPGYTIGSLGAYWTIQRISIMVGVFIK